MMTGEIIKDIFEKLLELLECEDCKYRDECSTYSKSCSISFLEGLLEDVRKEQTNA